MIALPGAEDAAFTSCPSASPSLPAHTPRGLGISGVYGTSWAAPSPEQHMAEAKNSNLWGDQDLRRLSAPGETLPGTG